MAGNKTESPAPEYRIFRSLMRKRAKSNAELGREIGISGAAVSRWDQRGKVPPGQIVAVAKALGVPHELLRYGTPDFDVDTLGQCIAQLRDALEVNHVRLPPRQEAMVLRQLYIEAMTVDEEPLPESAIRWIEVIAAGT